MDIRTTCHLTDVHLVLQKNVFVHIRKTRWQSPNLQGEQWLIKKLKSSLTFKKCSPQLGKTP